MHKLNETSSSGLLTQSLIYLEGCVFFDETAACAVSRMLPVDLFLSAEDLLSSQE
jgi:hypothetical protein